MATHTVCLALIFGVSWKHGVVETEGDTTLGAFEEQWAGGSPLGVPLRWLLSIYILHVYGSVGTEGGGLEDRVPWKSQNS